MAQTNDAARERAALSRRRKLRQLLGLVVCLFVIIGMFSVLSGTVRLVAMAFDDTEERLAFETRLSTLVAMDPVPFDNLEEASWNVLKDAMLWQTYSTIDRTTLEQDEVGASYLPTIDFDRTIASLFGPNVKITHETFESRDLTYTYVEEKQAYLLPITSLQAEFVPKVVKIKREGDTKRVTVGYISRYGTGGEFLLSASETPVKYYDFIFTKTGKEYYLTAMVQSETKADSVQSQGQTSLSSAPLNDGAELQIAVEDVPSSQPAQ